MAIDISPLWDFSHPDISEARFRAALEGAKGDDALILQTQIARCHGLRRDFEAARRLLVSMDVLPEQAGPEARARHALELGRTWCSATHPPESLTDENRESARRAYLEAIDIARGASLDAIAIDALHMLAFVDTEPEQQLHWGREALEIAQASDQPSARAWEASLLNNIGYAQHQLGHYQDALETFERALALREKKDNAEATRIARWMVAWTLRYLERIDEALAIQQRLESEMEAAGKPDPYVFEELEHLHRAKGDETAAAKYARLRSQAQEPG